MKKKLHFLKITLTLLIVGISNSISAQVQNSGITYEVHFLQGYGFINVDVPGSNEPEQTFQMYVANDYNNQPTELLNHDSGASNSGSYCYNMAVSTNIWGPEVDVNLAFIGGNSAGKFDFDIFSWEEDVAVGQCQYTTVDQSPGYTVKLISTSDSVAACEWRTDTLDIPNSPNPSKARIKYTWRYDNGRSNFPLNFGDITANGTKTHINSNRSAPSGVSNTTLLGYHNDWNSSDHNDFENATDVTYTFDITTPKNITISTVSDNTNFDTYIHLVKLNSNGNFVSYVTGNDDFSGLKSQLSEVLCTGKYAIVVEGYGTHSGDFELSVVTSEIPRIYVNQASTGNNDGTSWANAYTDLQDAIAEANDCSTEIWVAKGTYYPTSGSDTNISFEIPDNLKLYGGFAGNEPSNFDLNLRDFKKNTTILSGDIDKDKSFNGNSRHIIKTESVTASTRVDGFRIQDANCVEINGLVDFGGGWLNKNGNPTIINCFFYDNKSDVAGAAFANLNIDNTTNENPIIVNCRFIDNQSGTGGAVFQRFENTTGSSKFYNCLFSHNRSNYDGGAILIECVNESLQLEFINCTIADNECYGSDSKGAGIKTNGNVNLLIKNTVIADNSIDVSGTALSSIYQYGNTTPASISYSLVEYITSAGQNNNLDGDTEPKFAQDFDSNSHNFGEGYQAIACSPLIDAGTSVGVYATDFAGQSRTSGSSTDIGHFEYQGNPGSATRLYVKEGGSGNKSGLSWANAAEDLYWVQSTVFQCPNFNETWVAKGEYTPGEISRYPKYAIKSGSKIYGGFAGTESSLAERNTKLILTENATTLTGDIGHDDLPGLNFQGTNSQDIFDMEDCNNQTIIDGFVFTNVYDNDAGSPVEIHNSSPLITNCIFQNNYAYQGGGLTIGSNSNPVIDRCIFRGNQSSSDAGAIRIYSNNPIFAKFTNCLIYGNEHSGSSDQNAIFLGTYADNTVSLTLENCTIASNKGDAISLYARQANANTNLTLKNTIVYGNSQGIVEDNSSQGNVTQNISYSLVQGLTTGTENLNGNTINPNFVSMPSFNSSPTIDGDFHVTICSPVLNAGNNTGITSFDLANNSRRFVNQTVDMGAYEFQGIYSNSTLDLNGINLSSGVGNPALFYSNQLLAANKDISSTQNTLYQAGHSIELNPGFKVAGGAVFQAKIETLTCP